MGWFCKLESVNKQSCALIYADWAAAGCHKLLLKLALKQVMRTNRICEDKEDSKAGQALPSP